MFIFKVDLVSFLCRNSLCPGESLGPHSVCLFRLLGLHRFHGCWINFVVDYSVEAFQIMWHGLKVLISLKGTFSFPKAFIFFELMGRIFLELFIRLCKTLRISVTCQHLNSNSRPCSGSVRGRRQKCCVPMWQFKSQSPDV